MVRDRLGEPQAGCYLAGLDARDGGLGHPEEFPDHGLGPVAAPLSEPAVGRLGSFCHAAEYACAHCQAQQFLRDLIRACILPSLRGDPWIGRAEGTRGG